MSRSNHQKAIAQCFVAVIERNSPNRKNNSHREDCKVGVCREALNESWPDVDLYNSSSGCVAVFSFRNVSHFFRCFDLDVWRSTEGTTTTLHQVNQDFV